MKPIPPVDLSKYFWIGHDTPTETAGIPVGAIYINQTEGDRWLLRPTGWVKQTLADATGTALAGITAAGLSLLALPAQEAAAVVIVVNDVASMVEGASFGPAAPSSITVDGGVVTAIS